MTTTALDTHHSTPDMGSQVASHNKRFYKIDLPEPETNDDILATNKMATTLDTRNYTDADTLPLALPVAAVTPATNISHNKYLEKQFKKCFSIIYKMEFGTFEKILREGERAVAKNSVLTYARNLRRLARDIDASGEESKEGTFDSGNSFVDELKVNVPVAAFQMGLRVLSDDAAMLKAMSKSVRKARIAALLVGMDPEKKDETLTHSQRNVTYEEEPSVFSGLMAKYKGKYPTYDDWITYGVWLEKHWKEDPEWENPYAKETGFYEPDDMEKFHHPDGSDDWVGIHHGKAYREETDKKGWAKGRSLAWRVPVDFWKGRYSKIFVEYDYPELRDVIDELRAFAVKEQKEYQEGAAYKNVKEDKNWVEQPQIEAKAAEMRTILNQKFAAKDVTPPNFRALNIFYKQFTIDLIKKDQQQQDKLSDEWDKYMNDAEENEDITEEDMDKYDKKYKLRLKLIEKGRKNKIARVSVKYWTQALPEKLINKPFMSALINAFVAALYTDMPPRRLDWAKLKFISIKRFNKLKEEGDAAGAHDGGYSDGIYYVFPHTKIGPTPMSPKSFVVFGKNAGKSPQEEDLRVDNISKNIRTLGSMIYWISKMKQGRANEKPGAWWLVGKSKDARQGRSVVITNPGFKEIEENALGKRIKKIFSDKYGGVKKNITASLLRKIYISHAFKGDTEKKAKLAMAMNHSMKIQQAIYNKEGGEYPEIVTPESFLALESNQIPVDKWTKKNVHKNDDPE